MESGRVVQYNGDSIAQTRPYRTVFMYNGSGSSIAAGQAVALDTAVDPPGGGTNTGVHAIRTPNGSQDTLIAGGALRLIANLTWGEVVVEGPQTGVISAGAIAANALVECINAAGQVETMSAPAATKVAPIARATAAASGGTPGTVDLDWMNPLHL